MRTNAAKQTARHTIKTYMTRAREALHANGLHNLADHLKKYCEPQYSEDWCYEPEVLPDWELG